MSQNVLHNRTHIQYFCMTLTLAVSKKYKFLNLKQYRVFLLVSACMTDPHSSCLKWELELFPVDIKSMVSECMVR